MTLSAVIGVLRKAQRIGDLLSLTFKPGYMSNWANFLINYLHLSKNLNSTSIYPFLLFKIHYRQTDLKVLYLNFYYKSIFREEMV